MAKFDFRYIILRWFTNTVALFIMVKTIAGFQIPAGMDGLWVLLITAAVIALINMLVRPLIILITLPITFITFGLFTLVINAGLLYLASWLVPGFEIKSFWGAVIGSLFYGIVAWILAIFIPNRAGKKDIKVDYKVID
ncbi:MAG: phage holin family protein [bacterium]